MKKNKGIIISLAIILVIAVFSIGGVLLFKVSSTNKVIERFRRDVSNIKKSFEDKSLGDYEDEYNDLILECNMIISSKKINKINNIKLEFLKLKDNIANSYDDYEEEEEEEEDDDDDYGYEDEEEDYDYDDEFEDEDEDIASILGEEEEIEYLINNFLYSLPDAIDDGEFDIVEDYLYPNSSLYNEQKTMIKSWHDQGIEEEFLGCTLSNVIFSSNKLEGTVNVAEKFKIANPSSGTRTETFNWLYKFKYNEELEEYQITELCNP